MLARLFFILSVAFGLATGAGANAQTKAVQTLRVVPYSDLQSLDPIVTTLGIVQRHATMVYDFLFGRDENQVIKPQMVDTWSVSGDGLSWRFTLRSGLAFHDGTPVTSDDVVASLKRWGVRDSFGSQIFAVTVELKAEDQKTFTWKLNKPYGLMLQALSKSSGFVPAIMPRRIADTDPTKAITDPTGSGPFVFSKEEWVPGSKVVYLKNTRYIPRSEPANGTTGGKVVKVDRVEWLNIRDPQSASLALINGEVDFLENPSTDFLPKLREAKMSVVTIDKLGTQGVLRMNHLYAPFDNPKGREALLYLVNQKEMLSAMFGDPSLWKECYAYFVCGSPAESNVGVQPSFGKDPARAKKLFEEAGYKGETVIILHPTDVAFMNVATLVLADELKSIGVKVELQAMDYGAMAARRANRAAPGQGGWHIGMSYWPGLNIGDPIGNVPIQASCEKAWPGWPCDAAMQALIDKFPLARTDAERHDLTDQIQKASYERVVPYVPTGQWYAPIAYSPKLKGVIGVPGTIVLWNIEKTGG